MRMDHSAPVVKPMLTVVTGPPCSGKSTYIREHATLGDLVIDFDHIAQALGSPDTHNHPDLIRFVTMAARRIAIDTAIQCHQRTNGAHNIWIIDSRPTAATLRAYRRAGAHVVQLRADPAELHRRADAAGRPDRWHALIDDWFATRMPTPARTARTPSEQW